MLCDEEGQFPVGFDATWEKVVLEAEMALEGRVAWYRNPARPSQDSLGIVYEGADEKKIVRPDFLFFSQQPDGAILADIVDPHWHHLADSLPKLRGLANYAERNGDQYRRIVAVSVVDGQYRMLNLKEIEVRAVVKAASSAKAAFLSPISKQYP